MQVPVGGLHAGADVEPPAAAGRAGGGDERLGHVVDVHIVPRVAAVTEEPGRAPGQHGLGEDGDHAGLTVRVLPRAVHVRQRQARAV